MPFLSIKNVLPFADTLLLSNSNWNTGLYIYEDKLSIKNIERAELEVCS
jgi:hypothetical protein